MIKNKYDLITKITNLLFKPFSIYAEEGQGQAEPTNANGEPTSEPTKANEGNKANTKNNTNNNQPDPLNYEDLISRARQEEKDKLYPQLNQYKEKVSSLTKKNNELIIKVANLEEDNKSLRNSGNKAESDIVKDLKAKLKEAETKLANLESSVVDEPELRSTIEKEIKDKYEVKLYAQQKIAEFKDEIIPELISGETKEEIDKSLEKSKEQFSKLKERILGKNMRHIPASNINVPSGVTGIKLEDLVDLDPRSPEYKEARARLGLR